MDMVNSRRRLEIYDQIQRLTEIAENLTLEASRHSGTKRLYIQKRLQEVHETMVKLENSLIDRTYIKRVK